MSNLARSGHSARPGLGPLAVHHQYTHIYRVIYTHICTHIRTHHAPGYTCTRAPTLHHAVCRTWVPHRAVGGPVGLTLAKTPA